MNWMLKQFEMNQNHVERQKDERLEEGDVLFWVGWTLPEDRSFLLLPTLVLLSSFSWVSLSNKIWFRSLWWDEAALSWTNSAVLL